MKRSVLNKILLLRLIELAKSVTSYRKVTQLVYIMQEEGRKEKRVTFNYEFKKWHYEPYSVELEKDLQQLDLESLIFKNDNIELSEKGKRLTEKMVDFYQKEKIDSFFKFFAYLHMNETLYETSAYINDRYQIAKYTTDSVIAELNISNQVEVNCIDDLKKKIDEKFEEIENEDMENLLNAQKLLSNEKRYR